MTTSGKGPVWVAGGTGLVGSAVVRLLESAGSEVVSTNSATCELRDRAATADFVRKLDPASVVLCAARVGGIGANTASPVSMLSENVQIGTSVLDACADHGVPKVVVVASAAMYPASAPQPIREESMWYGPAEEAHEAYAAAKLCSVAHVRAIRRELGLPYVALAPSNIYGINDNFHALNSHVLPALLRKFCEAKESKAESVEVWGSGRARREFVFSDDLARAVEIALDAYDSDMPLNVGSGEDLAISEVVATVAATTGYDGDVAWLTDGPEGPARRLLDSSRLRALGWIPQTSLEDGLKKVYEWLTTELETGQVRGWSSSVRPRR